MEPMKHIDWLRVTKRFSNFTPDAGVIGQNGPAVTNFVNVYLSQYVTPLGGTLENTVSANPNADMGIYLSNVLGMVVATNGEPYQSPDGERRVHCSMSRRCPTTNLASITGLAIDHISQWAAVDATSMVLEYNVAAGTIRLSMNGGTTWGDPVVVTALATNEGIVLQDGVSMNNNVWVRRLGTALPAANQSDVIAVNDANFSVGYWWNNYQRPGETASLKSAFTMPSTDTLGIFLAIICQASMITPVFELYELADFIDVIEGGVPSTVNIVGNEIRADVNTAANPSVTLGFAPVNTAALNIVCRGYHFTPGLMYDYTVAGNVVTFYPANMGFHIATGEPVWFRGFTV